MRIEIFFQVSRNMRIRRFGSFSGAELGLVVGLGIIGGIYIWRPVFKNAAVSRENKPTEPETQEKRAS